jgi:2-desacetyl-2-hydroxyethyl bacteriochlorophyllide A dehydrogenase
MRSLVCRSPCDLKIITTRRPSPGRQAALIRVRRAAIGPVDLDIVRGTAAGRSYPRVPGQELAGEVVKAPAHSDLREGQPVFVIPYLSCGTCAVCRSGKPNCCPSLDAMAVDRDGGLAEYIVAPVECLLKTDGVTMDEAALLQFLAAGAHAVRRAGHVAGRVLVMGADGIGLAAALFARAQGASVTLLDERPQRLAFCRERLGFEQTLAMDEEGLAALKARPQDERFNVVFSATDDKGCRELGLHLVAQGGTCVLMGTAGERLAVPMDELLRREVTLSYSRHATAEDYRDALAAIKSGIPSRALITHRVSLSNLAAALPQWMDPGSNVIKGVVEL